MKIIWNSLDLYFGCLDLYFGWMNLYFECLNLHFECLDLYFECLNLYFECLGGRAGGRADGRPGRVTETFAKESILGICILKKLNIVYIIEYWLWGIFTKKTRAEISRKTHRRMSRDLSYETHLGPKTKTD